MAEGKKINEEESKKIRKKEETERKRTKEEKEVFLMKFI
jgi:hypothetical protein